MDNTMTQRVIFLDYLRVVACMMVILVHACEPFYLGGEGTYITNAYDAFWVTIVDSALRCAEIMRRGRNRRNGKINDSGR